MDNQTRRGFGSKCQKMRCCDILVKWGIISRLNKIPNLAFAGMVHKKSYANTNGHMSRHLFA